MQLDILTTNSVLVTVRVTNSTAGATIGDLTQNRVNQVNANPALQSADGVLASDFVFYSSPKRLAVL